MTEIVPPVSAIQTPRKEPTESRFSFDHQHRPQAKASFCNLLLMNSTSLGPPSLYKILI
jgi:hypothetical protein